MSNHRAMEPQQLAVDNTTQPPTTSLQFEYLQSIQVHQPGSSLSSVSGILMIQRQKKKRNDDNHDDDDTTGNSLIVKVAESSSGRVYRGEFREADIQLHHHQSAHSSSSNDNNNKDGAALLSSDTATGADSKVMQLLALFAKSQLSPQSDVPKSNEGSVFEVIVERNNQDYNTLQIKVNEQLQSGTVVFAWKNQLRATVDDPNKGSSVSVDGHSTGSMSVAGSTMFGLCQDLVRWNQELQQQLKRTQSYQTELQRVCDGWKDTAQSLEGQWVHEKDILVRNFFHLYNKKQEQVQDLQQSLQQTQQQLDQLEQEGSNNNNRKNSNNVGLGQGGVMMAPAFLDDLHRDDDEELYDAETVAQLAAGPDHHRVGRAKRGASSAASVSTTASASSASTLSKKRRNPHTGVVEYLDSNAVLEDPTVFPPNEKVSTIMQQKPRQPTRRPRLTSAAAAKKAPSKGQPAKRKKAKRDESDLADHTDDQDDDDDNHNHKDTPGDNFIDMEMQAMIHAQLDALRDADEIK